MKKTLKLLTIIFLAGCFSKEPEKTGHEGKLIESFNLLLIDSTTKLNTRNISTGKPFVILYYSPRCPYSKAQIAEITDNIDELKDFRFYLITPFPFREMKSISDEFQINKYQNITMCWDSIDFFGNHFDVKAFPYTAFYDKNKLLKKVYIGKISSTQIKDQYDN